MREILFLILVTVEILYCVTLDLCDSKSLVNNNVTAYKLKKEPPSNCSCTTRCIHKCCAFGYHVERSYCIFNNASSKFSVDIYNLETLIESTSNKDRFSIGIMKCKFYRLPDDQGEDFYVQSSGDLYIPSHDFHYSNEKYCLDDNIENTDTLAAFICFEERAEENLGLNINVGGMIISMPFLLVTFIIYTLLPERNLHMKALMSYVISLFFGYIFLVTIQLYPHKLEDVPCSLLAYLCVFAFMLSFYWMNVICVDIWFGFSSLRGFSGQRNSERKRFYFYCTYAWGMSILHILIVLAIQQLSPRAAWYNPGINDGQCFLADGYPELIYFYGPMGILITLNLILFALTATRIRRVKQDTKMLKKGDSKRHNYESDKQKFNLYLKLLLAMGVNWSMEIISWAVDWKLGQQTPPYVWYLTDFCNAAYGAIIFFIFVFKKSIWRMLKKRYYSFMGKPHLAHSMGTTQTRSTSYSATTSFHEMQPTTNGTTAALTSDVA